MAERPQLAQEIIDKIIDIISKDHRTLKSCALSSRPLVYRSQCHLFSTIELSRHFLCKRLRAVLTSNPQLRVYIRNLILSQSRTPQEPHGSARGWIRKDVNLSAVLGMLPSLQSFTFHAGYNGVTWKKMYRRTTAALFRLFALPDLSSIHFINLCDIPTSFLNIPATLKQFKVENSSFTTTTCAFDPNSRTQLSFKSLEFIIWPMSLAADIFDLGSTVVMHPNSGFSRITTLCIQPSNGNFSSILTILNVAAKSLTSIELEHSYYLRGEPHDYELHAFKFSLSSLPNLRSLSFTFKILYRASFDLHAAFQPLFDDLISFLASNAFALHRIVTLTLKFKLLEGVAPLSTDAPHTPTAWFLRLHSWGKLDQAIRRYCTRLGLRVKLVLNKAIHTRKELASSQMEWQEAMRGKCVLLEERGALILEVEPFSWGFLNEEPDADEKVLM